MDNINLANAIRQSAIKQTPMRINGDTKRYESRNFQISPELICELPDEFIMSGKFAKFMQENKGLNVGEVIRRLNQTGSKRVYANSDNDTASFSVNSNNSPKKDFNSKAKTLLLNKYDEIINEAKKSGNQRRAAAYKIVSDKIKNNELANHVIYKNLLNEEYNSIRMVIYPRDEHFDYEIDKITGKDTPQIKVRNESSWHYRMPINQPQRKPVERISVNATTNKELIEKLDNLFASGELQGYYKTPDISDDWLERHDPVTIYLYEASTNETLSKIAKELSPYIRSKEDVLMGKKFAPGFAIQKSPDLKDIEDILAKAKNLDPEFEQTLRLQFTRLDSKRLAISTGELEALKRLIEQLEK